MPNEATNFRESLAENLTDLAFGQGHFTETVWFYPNDPSIPPRDIDGIVTRKIKKRNKDRTLSTVDGLIRIKFLRSATLGVTDLVDGDAVRISTAADDSDRWAYEETVEESPHSVTATFLKKIVHKFGNMQADQL